MPRAVATKYVSGTETRRMRTKITASAPSADQDEPVRHGRRQPDPGCPRCFEDQRREADEEDQLAEGAGCQPVTASVCPFGSVPVYQSVNAESVSTRPADPRRGAAGLHRAQYGEKPRRPMARVAIWIPGETVDRPGATRRRRRDCPRTPAASLPVFAGLVDFAAAGTKVSGEFRCADCGYGAVVQRVLPPCPMCGGTVWERRAPLRGRVSATGALTAGILPGM